MVDANAVSRERMCVVLKTTAATLANCTLESIDMVWEREETCTAVDFSAPTVGWSTNHSLIKQLCNLSFVLRKSHLLCSKPSEGRLASPPMPLITEHHPAQMDQQLTVTKAMFMHKKSSSRAFEAMSLIIRDATAYWNSLAANTH